MGGVGGPALWALAVPMPRQNLAHRSFPAAARNHQQVGHKHASCCPHVLLMVKASELPKLLSTCVCAAMWMTVSICSVVRT